MRSEAHSDGLCTRKMSRPVARPDKNQLQDKDAQFVNPASARLLNNRHKIRLRDRGRAVRQQLAGVCKLYRRQVRVAEPRLNPGSLSGPKSLPETTSQGSLVSTFWIRNCHSSI